MVRAAWSATSWIESLGRVNQVLAHALLQPHGGLGAEGRLHLPFVRALGHHGSVEAVSQVLREGSLLDDLARAELRAGRVVHADA